MRRSLLTLAVAATMLLAGCSTTAEAEPDVAHLPDTEPVATTPASPSPTPTDDTAATYGERVINDRGNLVKEIGQLAGVSGEDDSTLAQFAVTDIVVDIECTVEYPEKPANGHFVGIHLNVETTPELAQDEVGTLSFSQWGWQAFDADGKRVNDPTGNAWWCLDSGDQLPVDIGPAQSVSGWIVLDLPTDHGAVVLTMGAPSGWEWAY